MDLYDNPSDLKAIFPSIDVIPDSVKIAHQLSSEEREALPDDVYALVLVDGQDSVRKFACVDEGNTVLNVAYFFKHAHKLPAPAQKTAAANLAVACGWYGLEVPEELEKVALGLSTVMNAAMLPSVLKGTGNQIRDNLAATGAAGGRIMAPHEQHAIGAMMKGAEVSGTATMPSQGPGNLANSGKRQIGGSNTSAMKCAFISPYVDVTGMEPVSYAQPAHNEHTAYRGMYPLDSYAQVKTASQYFDDNRKQMPHDMRHEFAVNLVKRASALGISVSDECRTYGSTTFAPEEQLRIALDTRRPFVTEKQAAVLDHMLEHRFAEGPDSYCEALSQFDKLAQITWRYDSAVMDPYLSTYGVKEAADDNDSWCEGNDYITKKQLENYAVTGFHTLKSNYGEDFAKEYKKDPWGIFSSLPSDQKKRIARAASDNGPTGLYDVQ